MQPEEGFAWPHSIERAEVATNLQRRFPHRPVVATSCHNEPVLPSSARISANVEKGFRGEVVVIAAG
jgi:hypothetical protein